MLNYIDRFFKVNQTGSTLKTEVIAGITTFMTMSYIIFVNPSIMEKAGMPFDSVMVATCLASAIATILMGILANYPIGLAPSMGINAFVTFSLVLGLKMSWQMSLAAIFIEGLIFIALSAFSIRTAIVEAIPVSFKIGISVGIGFFLAFIGLQSAGLVVRNSDTLIGLGSFHNINTMLAVFGFIVTSVLYVRRIKGAILLGICVTTIVAVILGVAKMPEGVVSMPPSLSPIFMEMDFSAALTIDFIIIILVLLYMDIFNTAGTLIGVAQCAGFLDKKGSFPRANKAFMSDAVGTAAGAALGVTTVTAYVESITGTEAGGRTGLTAVIIGICFILAMFFYPLVAVVPACATAPALIFVGILMMSAITEMDFSDGTESIPAVITIIMMPFTYNIATGIELGIISYTFIKALAGRWKEVSALMYVLTILFIIKEIFIKF